MFSLLLSYLLAELIASQFYSPVRPISVIEVARENPDYLFNPEAVQPDKVSIEFSEVLDHMEGLEPPGGESEGRILRITENGVEPFYELIPGASSDGDPECRGVNQGGCIHVLEMGSWPSRFGIRSNGPGSINPSRVNESEFFRIALVGDSVVYGAEVMCPETIPSNLERILNRNGKKYIVYNFGVEGYEAYDYAMQIRRLVPRVTPDLVIVGFVVNDALISRAQKKMILPFRDHDGALRIVQSQRVQPYLTVFDRILGVETNRNWLESDWKLFALTNDALARVIQPYFPASIGTLPRENTLLHSAIKEIKTLCDAMEAPLFAVCIPPLTWGMDRSQIPLDLLEFDDVSREWAGLYEELGIASLSPLDSSDFIENDPASFRLPKPPGEIDFIHYNGKGCSALAAEIADALAKQGLLQPDGK